MLYWFLRPTTRFFLKAYFRKIYVNGLENIPKEGPVILCSNHPTAFMEPCLLACFLPRELYFLVRADLFKRPLLSKILYATNQLPIYRFRDGIKELRNSHQIINKTYENLSNGKVLLIFPEASTEEVRYLRPIKKGAARMAVEMMQQYPGIEVPIIPIGLNYSEPNKFRSIVSIQIGRPIIPQVSKNTKDAPREIHSLTLLIKEKLSTLLLDIDRKEEAPLLDALIHLNSNFFPERRWPIKEEDKLSYFQSQKRISEALNHEGGTHEIFERLDNVKGDLEDNGFRELSKSKVNLLNVFLALLLFVPMTAMMLLNFIPALIGKLIEKKYVRVKEFHASVLIAATMGVYIVIMPILLLVGILIFGWYGFLVLLVPIFGRLSLLAYDYIREVWIGVRQNQIFGRKKRSELLEEARKIVFLK